MKPFAIGLAVSALFVSAPALYAQPSSQNIAPAPTQMAAIDPQARDLVARTMSRYRGLKSFESLISRTETSPTNEGGTSSDVEIWRIKLGTGGRFVVSSSNSSLGWSRYVYDGRDMLRTSASMGKTYEMEEIRYPFGMPRERKTEATLARIFTLDGPLIWFLNGSQHFSALALSPVLTRFDMESDGKLKKVSIALNYKKDTDADGEVGVPDTPSLLELWIDPNTLTLEQARTTRDTTVGTFTSYETYAQTRFNPTFDDTIFRVAAPRGYTRQKAWSDYN